MSEDKLALAQEELVSSTNQLNNREAQIQDLKTGGAALEKDLIKKDEKLKQQEEALRELQKQQVLPPNFMSTFL